MSDQAGLPNSGAENQAAGRAPDSFVVAQAEDQPGTAAQEQLAEGEAAEARPDEAAAEAPSEETAGEAGSEDMPGETETAEAPAPGERAVPALLIDIPSDAYPLPGTGDRLVITVPAGGEVSLDDPAFNPQAATYAVSGSDLVITLADGGVIVLADFFQPGGLGETTLSVLGGPEVSAEQLLASAEALPEAPDEERIEPAAGEPAVETAGGGADFRPFELGPLGEGLNPLGPLGPTAIGFDAEFPDVADDETLELAGADGLAPSIDFTTNLSGTVVERSQGFNPTSTPRLPIRGEGQRVAEDEINGVDRGNVTLDVDREISITFLSETSLSVDSLFVYEVNEDGELTAVRPVFPFVNEPGERNAPPALEPGSKVSLGVVPEGTELGLLLVNDAFRDNQEVFGDGRFELRGADGGPATIADGDPPKLVHIAEDGTETELEGRVIFTSDSTPDDPTTNPLNSNGIGRVVSGWEDQGGRLVIGFEDGLETLRPDHPFGSNLDFDFNDAVFAIDYGPFVQKNVVFNQDGRFFAEISDPDSTEMSMALLKLDSRGRFVGDRLVAPDTEGTNIEVDVRDLNTILLTGVDSVANYETVIGRLGFETTAEDPGLGQRIVSATVWDAEGNISETSLTAFQIREATVGDSEGGEGDDVIVGTSETTPGSDGDDIISGRGGDDVINARSGNDVVDGGPGNDIIDANRGNDIVIGGPGADTIFLGPDTGVNEIRYTGLADGFDTVFGFDGKRDTVNLDELFRDSPFDPESSDISDFLQLRAADVSGNGQEDDVILAADLDGGGDAQRFVDIMGFVDPKNVDGLCPDCSGGSDGATS